MPDEPAIENRPHQREMLVVLLRHGESMWNAERRYQGQLGPGLTDLGRDQARRAADFLATAFPPFHHAVASDLPRVQETVRPWRELTGVEPAIDVRWREIDAGDWSGRLRPEVRELYPEQVAAVRRGEDIARGGGETMAQLRARAWLAMTDVARLPVGDLAPDEQARVVVFTHGGCIHMVTAEVLGLPPMGHRWLREPANCSATTFRLTVDPNGRLLAAAVLDYDVETGVPAPELLH